MKQGFYYIKEFDTLILVIRNTNLNRYLFYKIYSPTNIGRPFDINPNSVFVRYSEFLIPFDHYPTFEELEQFPELFI